MSNFENQEKSIIECPECGCKEIHFEYNNYAQELLAKILSPKERKEKPSLCYCLCCGVMFAPITDAFAV
ncbi:MAG: hypothetical protein LBQ60_21690 [Bacteroidales bacterium]|jgi:hypothetical protein|nr:hypothetical protein [Bacteroidales bacterium]